jgi:hypothetical protein
MYRGTAHKYRHSTSMGHLRFNRSGKQQQLATNQPPEPPYFTTRFGKVRSVRGAPLPTSAMSILTACTSVRGEAYGPFLRRGRTQYELTQHGEVRRERIREIWEKGARLVLIGSISEFIYRVWNSVI